jgi:hypothetical protein
MPGGLLRSAKDLNIAADALRKTLNSANVVGLQGTMLERIQ